MNDPIFSEDDLKVFFSDKAEQKRSSNVEVKKEIQVNPANNFRLPTPPLPGTVDQVETSFAGQYESAGPSFFQTISKFFGIFTLIFVISFTIINGPALVKKMKYFYAADFRNQSTAANKTIPNPVVNESKIIIPKIQVNAPITWNVSEEQITQKLENGVAHYKDSALPGQIGNVFITGHSSYYIWAKGDYKDVFALLDKLQAGDKIYIQYNGANFTYEVTGQNVVNPDNLTVLNPTKDKTLTLMTCVPIGTTLKRLVISAKQIAE